MNETRENNEHQELVNIYTNLSIPLREQLMMFARIINSTQEITLRENNKQERSLQNIK